MVLDWSMQIWNWITSCWWTISDNHSGWGSLTLASLFTLLKPDQVYVFRPFGTGETISLSPSVCDINNHSARMQKAQSSFSVILCVSLSLPISGLLKSSLASDLLRPLTFGHWEQSWPSCSSAFHFSQGDMSMMWSVQLLTAYTVLGICNLSISWLLWV